MEKWDLLDGDGRPLGQTLVRGDKLRPGQYHLVVHIWVEDSKGRLLIQKRAPHLKLMPDTWAVTGGSALAGEDSLTAAARELSEELGIEAAPSELKRLGRLRRRNSLCDLWRLRLGCYLCLLPRHGCYHHFRYHAEKDQRVCR